MNMEIDKRIVLELAWILAVERDDEEMLLSVLSMGFDPYSPFLQQHLDFALGRTPSDHARAMLETELPRTRKLH